MLPLPLRLYPYSEVHETRWADNDIFGHVNNAKYYDYVDSAVNRYLISRGALALPRDPSSAETSQRRGRLIEPAFLFEAETSHERSTPSASAIGLVVESGCNFFAPLAYPDKLLIGVRVGHIGRSSVRYEMGVFRAPEDAATRPRAELADLEPAAQAFYVHVYVDPVSRRPVKALPSALRDAVAALHTVATPPGAAAPASDGTPAAPLR